MKHVRTKTSLASMILLLTSLVTAQDQPAAIGSASPFARTDHPVIIAIRDSKPNTPAELLQAAEAMLDFDLPEECRRYLTVLIEKKPTVAQLAQAHQKIGSGVMIRLGRDEKIQPEGATISKMVLDAAYSVAHDKRNIDVLVRQATGPDALKREKARIDLRGIGVDVIESLLAVISQQSRESEHRFAQAAILELQDDLLPPLIAALDAKKPLLREKALEVVAETNSRDALYRILRRSLDEGKEAELARLAIQRQVGPLPGRAEIETVLSRKVEDYLAGMWSQKPDVSGLVRVWYWNHDTDVLASRLLPPKDAALMAAARFAGDLVALDPSNVRYRRLAMLTELEWRYIDRLGTSVGKLPTFDLAELQDALHDAIDRKRPVAMLGILQAIAKQGNESLLYTKDGRESFVASLLKHTDRRVRLEACRTIIGWKPTTTFPGASHLTDNLGYFLASTGTPKVLIADVREDHAQTLVGLLGEAGYEGEAFYTSKQFIQQGMSQPDYEFAIISDAVNAPRAAELVNWLRRDYRTNELAVAITQRAGYGNAIEKVVRDEPRVMVIPTIHADQLINTVADDATEVERLKAEREKKDFVRPARSIASVQIQKIARMNGREFVSAAGRFAQAMTAAELIKSIFAEAKSPLRADLGRLEPVFLDMVNQPEHTAVVAPFLGEVGSAKAQTVLVDLASQPAAPLVARRAAAAAFARAVERRGILLTKEQIRLQFERYNQSEFADKETQAVLSSLLDTMEARSKKVSQR